MKMESIREVQSLNEKPSRWDLTADLRPSEKLCELEDRRVEITQSKEQGEKKVFKN